MLAGKKVTLGVTGSIAAYKMANVASMLKKLSCEVQTVLTENAAKFITPVTFEAITGRPCLTDDFKQMPDGGIAHIALGQKSDLLFVAPASADILAKMAYGIADDLLTSTVVAASCPILVAPAMNAHMYRNPIVQDNIKRLRSFGYEVIEPETGHLACGVSDIGRLPKEDVLVDAVIRKLCGGALRDEAAEAVSEGSLFLGQKGRLLQDEAAEEVSGERREDGLGKEAFEKRSRDFTGLRILVTAGPTRESLDPIRFLTNHSTGKMGYAVAKEAAERGAKVTLISGPVSLAAPKGVNRISVVTAEEMYRAVMEESAAQDIIVKAAAVADYRPKQVNSEKIKKRDGALTLELERTKDILAELGAQKGAHQCLCGFCMETEHVLTNAREKLIKKNADLIAANSVREAGAGFGGDTNRLTLISREGEEDLGLCSKEACAKALLDRLYRIWKIKQEK